MAHPRPDPVTISVVRTGGFAGLRREWTVRSTDAPDVDWSALIDACPWRGTRAVTAPTANDRFVWHVEVAGARSCSATVQDHDLTGPWRLLTDGVRAHAHG